MTERLFSIADLPPQIRIWWTIRQVAGGTDCLDNLIRTRVTAWLAEAVR